MGTFEYIFAKMILATALNEDDCSFFFFESCVKSFTLINIDNRVACLKAEDCL